MFRNSRRWVRYSVRRVQRMRDTPQSIARGLGVGAFAGCLPLFGCQTAIGVMLAVLFRGNKLCAALATWLSNPLTYLPIFWLNYNVGLWLLPNVTAPDDRIRWDSVEDMLASMRDLSVPLGLGSLTTGAIVGLAVYAIVLLLLRRRARLKRHARVRRSLRRHKIGAIGSPVSSGKPSKIVEYNQ